MVLYACKDNFDEAHLNTTGVCYHPNMPPSFKACVGVSPMFAWAVGGVVSSCFAYFVEEDQYW